VFRRKEMSWYTEYLLRNSLEIKSKSDIDADDFNDLLVLEGKIQELYSNGLISQEELRLIEYIEDGKPIVNSKEDFGKNRMSLARDINKLSDKIAFYIGGYFTDDGYVHYMKTKYNLQDGQVEKMIDYMKSKYKNKLIRKINDIRTNES